MDIIAFFFSYYSLHFHSRKRQNINEFLQSLRKLILTQSKKILLQILLYFSQNVDIVFLSSRNLTILFG
jgi:hypothetical protein